MGLAMDRDLKSARLDAAIGLLVGLLASLAVLATSWLLARS
jgi:hypothetical protein